MINKTRVSRGGCAKGVPAFLFAAALLEPRSLETTRLYLDRLVSLGVQGVRVTIDYPLLTSGFPNSAGYLEFYKQVAQLARERHLTFAVHAAVIFEYSVHNIGRQLQGTDIRPIHAHLSRAGGDHPARTPPGLSHHHE